MSDSKLLAIYLNDHLAASTGGLELGRRTLGSNRGNDFGEYLEKLVPRLEHQRATLLEVMGTLDVGVDRVKVAGAWAGEKLGRLKPNGRLRSYSPLSRVVELEILALGSQGRLGLWRTLDQLRHETLSGFDFAALAHETEQQIDQLDTERRRAAAQAFT
jgi:hypothetical protein